MALFFPEFEIRTRCVLRILWCVPPKRSISFAQLSAEQTSLDLNFEIHNLGPFFSLSESQLLLEFSHFSTSCWVSPTISMSIQAFLAIDAPVSRLVITTHRRMPIITRRFSTSCTSKDKEFLLWSKVWPLDLSSVCRQSVLFPVGTEEDACSLPFRLRSLWFEAGYSCVLRSFR